MSWETSDAETNFSSSVSVALIAALKDRLTGRMYSAPSFAVASLKQPTTIDPPSAFFTGPSSPNPCVPIGSGSVQKTSVLVSLTSVGPSLPMRWLILLP